MKIYETVLVAKFLYKANGLFFYRIEGSPLWLSVFEEQKKPYIRWNELGELIYSVPWYYGGECTLCVNDFNNKVFFDLNEHEAKASLFAQLKQDYWADLAKSTNDEHWLTRSKTSVAR